MAGEDKPGHGARVGLVAADLPRAGAAGYYGDGHGGVALRGDPSSCQPPAPTSGFPVGPVGWRPQEGGVPPVAVCIAPVCAVRFPTGANCGHGTSALTPSEPGPQPQGDPRNSQVPALGSSLGFGFYFALPIPAFRNRAASSAAALRETDPKRRSLSQDLDAKPGTVEAAHFTRV